jgi:hypothetical protein
MATSYYNDYLDLSIDFPDPWILVCWQNLKLIDGAYFQTSNNDFPESEGQSKFLFTAQLYTRHSLSSIDADIEMSVMLESLGHDMRQGIMDNASMTEAFYSSNGLEKTIVRDGSWSINEVEYQYLEEMLTDKNGRKSKYRFVFRKINDSLWLYAKIAGHNESSYQQALNIFSTLTWGTRGKLAPTP